MSHAGEGDRRVVRFERKVGRFSMKVAKFSRAVVEQLAAGVVCASDASCRLGSQRARGAWCACRAEGDGWEMTNREMKFWCFL